MRRIVIWVFATLLLSINCAQSMDAIPLQGFDARAVTTPRSASAWGQNGVYVTRANLPGTLERLTQSGRLSGWRYRTAVDTIEDFDADGRLLSVRNRAGLTHTLSYDVKKRPITVTDSYGRTLQFRYYDATSGYLTSLIEASNRSIRYAHDADGNLTRVTLN